MIKAKELRIGNWVLDMYDNKVKVTIIDDTVDWAKPIPLTPEILEKSGFVKQMEWTYCIEIQVGQKLVYYLGEKGWSIGNKNYSDFENLKYLHQLQNLYHALTGEELEVNYPPTANADGMGFEPK